MKFFLAIFQNIPDNISSALGRRIGLVTRDVGNAFCPCCTAHQQRTNQDIPKHPGTHNGSNASTNGGSVGDNFIMNGFPPTSNILRGDIVLHEKSPNNQRHTNNFTNEGFEYSEGLRPNNLNHYWPASVNATP